MSDSVEYGNERAIPVDRPWKDYPVGTKAHSIEGGYWLKTYWGWKWCMGDTFPTPGATAFTVTLPA